VRLVCAPYHAHYHLQNTSHAHKHNGGLSTREREGEKRKTAKKGDRISSQQPALPLPHWPFLGPPTDPGRHIRRQPCSAGPSQRGRVIVNRQQQQQQQQQQHSSRQHFVDTRTHTRPKTDAHIAGFAPAADSPFLSFFQSHFYFHQSDSGSNPSLQKSTDIPRYESTNHCSVVSAKQSSYPGQLQLEAPEKPGDGRTDGSQRDAGRLRPKPPRPAARKEDRQLDGRLPLLFDLNWLALGGKHGA
jgi:hypothetical protein